LSETRWRGKWFGNVCTAAAGSFWGRLAESFHRREPAELFADDFDEDAFGSSAIEFAVEDLLPGAEVELSPGDGDDHFSAHELALHVGVGVVLPGAVVGVSRGRGVERGEFLEPTAVVLMQAGLVVVDENAGSDVHGVAEEKALLNAGLGEEILQILSDVKESHPLLEMEREVLSVAFHDGKVPKRISLL
jgi:hypothetical protein